MNRTHQEFLLESQELGYLSFRDDEVNWNTVKIVENGKVVSIDGTFLGHVAPDQMGNRYAINLSAVSGQDPIFLFNIGNDENNPKTGLSFKPDVVETSEMKSKILEQAKKFPTRGQVTI